MYGSLKDSVEEGNVYRFNAIIAQQYRKEGEKFGRLRTQSESKIRAVSDEISALFSHVSAGDSQMPGILIGHEAIHYYPCCKNCWKKNYVLPSSNKVKTCQYCGAKVENGSEASDFSVNLVICESRNDELKTFLVFRRHLGIAFNSMTEKQVQAFLEGKHLRHCSIEYDKDDSMGKSVIMGLAVSFAPCTEDASENASDSALVPDSASLFSSNSVGLSADAEEEEEQ